MEDYRLRISIYTSYGENNGKRLIAKKIKKNKPKTRLELSMRQ
jgi:hypothetical protein